MRPRCTCPLLANRRMLLWPWSRCTYGFAMYFRKANKAGHTASNMILGAMNSSFYWLATRLLVQMTYTLYACRSDFETGRLSRDVDVYHGLTATLRRNCYIHHPCCNSLSDMLHVYIRYCHYGTLKRNDGIAEGTPRLHWLPNTWEEQGCRQRNDWLFRDTTYIQRTITEKNPKSSPKEETVSESCARNNTTAKRSERKKHQPMGTVLKMLLRPAQLRSSITAHCKWRYSISSPTTIPISYTGKSCWTENSRP